jgi:hypothetical protein
MQSVVTSGAYLDDERSDAGRRRWKGQKTLPAFLVARGVLGRRLGRADTTLGLRPNGRP